MDAAELTEWEAFYANEPWGDVRADHQTALLAHLLANQWGGNRKLKDFLPDWWGEQESSVAKMLAVGRAFAAATQMHGGKSLFFGDRFQHK